MPLNYSKWDQLEVIAVRLVRSVVDLTRSQFQLSDDSDIEGHPNVDHKSLVRYAPAIGALSNALIELIVLQDDAKDHPPETRRAQSQDSHFGSSNRVQQSLAPSHHRDFRHPFFTQTLRICYNLLQQSHFQITGQPVERLSPG